MEDEGANPDDEVRDECGQKDLIVAIFKIVLYTFVGQVSKKEIREGVDYLC